MNEQYKKHGYQLFRSALPIDAVTTLSDMAYGLITPYRGEIRRQDGRFAINEFHPAIDAGEEFDTQRTSFPSRRSHAAFPCAARAHYLFGIFERLHELDGAEHYTIHQTIIFIAAQSTVPHLDSWSMDTAPHGFAHTVWIPLEDMDYLSGFPAVVPWPVG